MVIKTNCHVIWGPGNSGSCAPGGSGTCIPHTLPKKTYRANMNNLGIATIPTDLLICVDQDKGEVVVLAGNKKDNKFKKIGAVHIPDVVILEDIYDENTKEAK